ncbi:hypothetical protein MKZ15_15610 [Paenibacillus sp. FSL R7-0216]|uniref:hypothetical protein n=1 Tax=Paenibacillus sp. FSL R7-0216 TaxID=2921677 RepID=UPI0030DA46F6
MIRIGVFNGSGSRDKPQPMIIKSDNVMPDPNTISFFASNQNMPSDKEKNS